MSTSPESEDNKQPDPEKELAVEEAQRILQMARTNSPKDPPASELSRSSSSRIPNLEEVKAARAAEALMNNKPQPTTIDTRLNPDYKKLIPIFNELDQRAYELTRQNAQLPMWNETIRDRVVREGNYEMIYALSIGQDESHCSYYQVTVSNDRGVIRSSRVTAAVPRASTGRFIVSLTERSANSGLETTQTDPLRTVDVFTKDYKKTTPPLLERIKQKFFKKN